MTIARVEPCWNRIGVSGDGSCPELAVQIHCRNCPVFYGAGRGLLERDPPEGYVEEWTLVLARERELRRPDTMALVIFRVGGEVLALDAPSLAEVRSAGRVHSLPRRTNEVLLGVVNLGGEIRPCFSLARLLGLDASAPASTRGSAAPGSRWVVLADAKGPWVFAVDEVLSLQRIAPEDVREAPATVEAAAGGYARGVFAWRDHEVGLLDAPRVLSDLARWTQ